VFYCLHLISVSYSLSAHIIIVILIVGNMQFMHRATRVVERLKQLDMIEVFKIVHNYYDPGVSVKFNFNPFGITRGNKFKL